MESKDYWGFTHNVPGERKTEGGSCGRDYTRHLFTVEGGSAPLTTTGSSSDSGSGSAPYRGTLETSPSTAKNCVGPPLSPVFGSTPHVVSPVLVCGTRTVGHIPGDETGDSTLSLEGLEGKQSRT